MSYFVSTRWGGDQREPTPDQMREVLTELDTKDIEHPDVSLTHESEWSLGAFPGGLLTWENVEADDGPRHMNDVARARVLELWVKLSEGRIAEIDSEPWLPGYEDPA